MIYIITIRFLYKHTIRIYSSFTPTNSYLSLSHKGSLREGAVSEAD